MRKLLLLGAVALLGSPLLLVSGSARATTISIGLQEAGYNSGNITTVATDAGNPGSANFAGSYGTFSFNNISSTGAPLQPQPTLDTTSVQVSSNLAATIDVFITESGLSSPQGVSSFLSSFTAQAFIGSAVSVDEKTFVSANNHLYGGNALASASFTGAGTTSVLALTPLLNGLYSETVEYIITVGSGFANVNDTINISAPSSVPEPISLALLGSSLVGFGLVRRRRG